MKIMHQSRRACSIDDGDTVLITGGLVQPGYTSAKTVFRCKDDTDTDDADGDPQVRGAWLRGGVASTHHGETQSRVCSLHRHGGGQGGDTGY